MAGIARDGGRMVAPTGVNEGFPQDPAKAGQTGAELVEPEAAEAKPGGTAPAEEKAGPAGVVPSEMVPAQAEPRSRRTDGGRAGRSRTRRRCGGRASRGRAS